MANLYKEISGNLQEQEDLFEMSNLRASETGLLGDLWAEERGESRNKSDSLPRVKVKIKNGRRIPISISNKPVPLVSVGDLKAEDLKIIDNAIPYIKKHADLFLKYYKGEISTTELSIELYLRGALKLPKTVTVTKVDKK